MHSQAKAIYIKERDARPYGQASLIYINDFSRYLVRSLSIGSINHSLASVDKHLYSAVLSLTLFCVI